MKVLYIAGSGRSGSTIVSQVLGQLDGFVAVGELWNVWQRGLVERRRCGCGIPVPECPLWADVLEEAFGRPLRIDPVRIAALGRRYLELRALPGLLRSRGRSVDPVYRDALVSLYGAVARRTGCRVLVDSSKSPVYAEVLRLLLGLDVRVVHLVRDARASAYSWLRTKDLPDFGDDRTMIRQPPLTSARRWLKHQALTEGLWGRRDGRYLRVRYEDLIAEPRGWLARIVRFVDEDVPLAVLQDERTVRLATTHSVSGNPARFSSGAVTLRPDDEWVGSMARGDRARVTAVTWPLLRRYGYLG